MIGNDIVDINKARSEGSWKRARFIKKIFAESERPRITSFGSPFLNIWRMWSMKESVYKVIVQTGEERFLNPQKLICNLVDDNNGYVEYDGVSYATQTVRTSNYIYSSHTKDKYSNVINEILHIKDPSEHSKMTKLALFQRVANMLEYPVKKLYHKQEPLSLQFSLTHHGNYGAYSLIKEMKSTLDDK
jgi:phosphopantetheinyl transferase (holo-ACP synthase)